MGTHIKITVDIADDSLRRAKRFAYQESRTLRELIEEGLALVLLQGTKKPARVAKLPTSGGDGLTADFAGASWERYRNEIFGSDTG